MRDEGSLNENFPGGTPAQARLLGAERFAIAAGKGKKPPCVKEFDKFLARN